jgi:hypothetical protein
MKSLVLHIFSVFDLINALALVRSEDFLRERERFYPPSLTRVYNKFQSIKRISLRQISPEFAVYWKEIYNPFGNKGFAPSFPEGFFYGLYIPVYINVYIFHELVSEFNS